MSKKAVRVTVIVLAVAVAAYLGWRWYQNRQAQQGANGMNESGLGTNLNSVAPELVGGSSGPTAGPAVSMPLNITLQETAAPPEQEDSDGDMDSGKRSHKPIHRQRHHASLNPGGTDVVPPSDTPDTGEEPQPGADVPAGATSATGQTGGGMEYV